MLLILQEPKICFTEEDSDLIKILLQDLMLLQQIMQRLETYMIGNKLHVI